jgi:CheY-like chemotaxis protein
MDKKKVLVVEDHSDTRELISLIIRQSGYDVIEAATGTQAMDRAQACHPDLIIMDLSLPELTGDEVVARLRADQSTRDIPVIVNTAHSAHSELVQRATTAGAREILHKPISFMALRDIVSRCLSSPDPATNAARA